MPSSRRLILAGAVVVLGVAAAAARQGSSVRAALPFTVISQEARRPLAANLVGDQVMVALDDLAALFLLAVREDAPAGVVTVGYKGRTIILTPGQAIASAGGRLVSLPVPVARDGRRWLVPIEFISRALGPVYDAKLDVRKNSRLVLVGDVRVPRVSVSEETIGLQARVTFDVTPRTPYTVTAEPSRLLVRFDADALDVMLPSFAPQGLLQSIRLADPNTTVVIDVGPRYLSYRSSFVPREGNAGQVLIDLVPAAPEPGPQAPSRPPAPPPEPPSPGASPAPVAFGTIAIDPGHGGEEIGVKGAGGTEEKDVTLSVALRLKAAIEGRLGVRVLLTRDRDQRVMLDERAAVANNNKADLFVSLHANASIRREVSGAQVYYLSADAASRDPRETAVGRHLVPVYGGGSRDIEMIPWEMAQERFLSESASLAGAIEEQLRGRVRLNARSVQPAPVRVLAGANMPAVLVEVGFLTNLDEEHQLASDAYLGTVAEALVDGLLRYRDLAARPREAALPEPPRTAPPGAGRSLQPPEPPRTAPPTAGRSLQLPEPPRTAPPTAGRSLQPPEPAPPASRRQTASHGGWPGGHR